MTLLASRPALRRALFVLTAAAALAACDGGATADETFADDLAGRFKARTAYAPLADALELAGVDLSGGPFTVFAPSEAALRYVGSDFSPVLFAEPQRAALARVLRHHVVAGRLAPEDLTDGATLTALDGTTLTVRRVGPVVTVNGVTVDVVRPIPASNGVAYPVADVLLDNLTTAERLRLSPSLTLLDQAFRVTSVSATVAGLRRPTILAPINDAFQGLGSGTLSLLGLGENADIYRRVTQSLVLPGDVDLAAAAGQTVTTLAGDRLPVTRDADGVLFVDGIRVLHEERTADGRVYILGAPVLSTLTVGERLRIRPDLERFRQALASVDGALAALSDRSARVTVFAPTDAAYLARSSGLQSALAEPTEAPLVRRVTAVHVVRGGYAPEALTPGILLTAFEGTVLRIDRPNGDILIDNTVRVERPQRQANGYLYTTADAFLLPAVDLLDTVLLLNYVQYFRLVRRVGLEPGFRAAARTAFAVPDAAIGPLLELTAPEARTVLQRTATGAFLPVPADLAYPATFTSLNGDTRTLNRFDCPLILGDRDCSPFGFELVPVPVGPQADSVFVNVPTPQFYQGGRTQNGQAVFHRLRDADTLPEPPEPPQPRRQAERGQASRRSPAASTSASQRS